MPSSWLYQTPWEEYFTVVQWDQRGTGKTYLANDPASTAATINVQRMVADGEEVTAWLRKTYGKQKIFVMGHSWGTVIGLELAMRHPDWLHAYVGMGQLIASQQNESLSYTFALGQARLRNNAQALKELKSIAPYPAADGSLTVDKVETERKWVVFFGGLSWHRNNNDGVDNAQVLSPDYSDADMNWGAGALSTIVNLLPSLSRIDFDGVNQVGCPLFLFAGRHDYETPSAISTAWFARLWAPQKRLVWFENSAHEIQYQEPGKVFMHLVKDVRPIAERAGDVPPTDGFDRE